MNKLTHDIEIFSRNEHMKEEKRELIPFLENQFTSHPHPVFFFVAKCFLHPKICVHLSTATAPPETQQPGILLQLRTTTPQKSPQIQHRYQTWPYLNIWRYHIFPRPAHHFGSLQFSGGFLPPERIDRRGEQESLWLCAKGTVGRP